MANNGAPDSWETQADSASGEVTDPNDMSAKFSTLNVNAAEFVPSFSFAPPSGDSDTPAENADTPETPSPVTNGKAIF